MLFRSYRESPGYGGQQCVRVDDWKLVRQNLNANTNASQKSTTELYDLAADPHETTNLAVKHPEMVEQLSGIALAQHTPSKLWPIRALDQPETAQSSSGKTPGVSDFSDNDANPAMRRIEDDPKLPRVLLIGDSISIGYTLEVRKLLARQANVHRIPANGGPTSNGLAHLGEWLGTNQWDVVHFNWGLHDLKIMTNGQHQVELVQYADNLRQLVNKLKATRATLIWASTTPVPEGKLNPLRHPEDVPRYNEAALRVMRESGVRVNDLYSFALPRLSEIQLPANVHFKPDGSAKLAQPVADSIVAALKERKR